MIALFQVFNFDILTRESCHHVDKTLSKHPFSANHYPLPMLSQDVFLVFSLFTAVLCGIDTFTFSTDQSDFLLLIIEIIYIAIRL
jgi:hypothetical protein